MKVAEIYNYRNAEAAISTKYPGLISEIRNALESNNLNLGRTGKQRALSKQVQDWFCQLGWQAEVPSKAALGMRYDLWKEPIPIEIELGHKRLVYPDFFEFMADYSASNIPAAIMIVANQSLLFGHTWHCSLDSTIRKINGIRHIYLVPTLLIAVDP